MRRNLRRGRGAWSYISERTVVRANCEVCAAKGIKEPIALAEMFYIGGGDDHPNRAHANARLIAAAPDLFEALAKLLDASERHIFSTECQTERDAARAALSKATGKE